MTLPDLPVTRILPDLRAALAGPGHAVLVAPPGAGKTTLVPLALLGEDWRGGGTILLLEPRRLAARAAARRMAALLGEEVGATVGYAMRMDRQVSAATRILVVTEGVLARMILDDPELAGIACVVFDEFHERSLDGDFGLALALDVKQGLRPDLRLVVMSATLDGARVARLLGDAPVIESHGRSFPVDIRHRERTGGETLEDAVAAAVRAALAEEDGGILAFLPGQREIERTAERLAGRLPANADLIALFGAMDGKAQDAAIRPAPDGRRKIVLATAIAETSITIDGVRVAIDSGYQRLPKFEPATGLTRLETVRVSRASAEQRAGRAGRTAPGVAIRLWRAEQTASLPAFTPPEIVEADLAGLVLDCAAFGVVDPTRLAFLDPPPAGALAAARALLRDLEAIDETGRLTADGVAMRRLALPARLAHMVARAAQDGAALQAADLAVLLTERGLGGQQIDLDARLARFRRDRGARAGNARALAKRLAAAAGAGLRRAAAARPETGATGAGRLLLHAWPDRVAMARGGPGRYVLANGRGGEIDPADPLAAHDFLVVADLQGKARNARIVAAAPVAESDLRAVLADRIETGTETGFDRDSGTVRARERSRLGAITLAERPLPAPSGAEADRALLEAVHVHGVAILPWGKKAAGLRRRLAWLRRGLGEPWPEMDDAALRDTVQDWLAPFLTGSAAIADISDSTLAEALLARVGHEDQRRVAALAPTHFDAPSGNRIPIDYRDDAPVLAVRVQELFGLDRHPAIAAGTVPLTLELLSPAQRPIQTTRDLPGFWRGSWAEVRAAMRGRYPKHPWPEEPLRATPTARAKPRGH
ncbi:MULTISPECIES: ATP-dependent helicase HrpB [Nitratireductor]|uniref:ATP-dependent helicase HrpB n=1 Tax=Nitratireductor TaxID=245876 RepID=UPI000D0DE41D|nr:MULTISPECIES: ATP-dependent helicase HrpB [Nitratireductor]PSM19325.1 ATP-dependent helicase HrpB [Nitratireductor sp. StC3]